MQSRDSSPSAWTLPMPLLIWAAHLLLSYVTAAIVCEKSPEAILPAQGAIAAYTVLALLGIAMTGWKGWRRHGAGKASLPHDDDSPGDRTRFLGFAAFLMSALSAVAVIFLALSVALVGTCR